MSELKAKITADMKQAMKSQQKLELSTIRMLLAAIKQVEIDNRVELDDAGVLAVVEKMCKQRREAAQQFTDAGRDDLATKENSELECLINYLPEQLSDAELTEIISATIAETGAQSMKDMGKVMAVLKPKLQGRADMSGVSKQIKQLLTQA